MASTSERWIDGLKYSSLFWPSPQDPQQRKAQITAYVKYLGQFTSATFQDDIAELVRSHYLSKEERLLDCVLAMFVLHHREYCIADEYSKQWALGCGEILRILTVYNRPICKQERQNCEGERSGSSSYASTSESFGNPTAQPERKPLRPLSPWITDLLLAAPLDVKSDYFRWCGCVMGKYAVGELKPPPAVGATWALAYELQLFPKSNSKKIETLAKPARTGASVELESSVGSAIHHMQRILAILEALFLLKPSSIGTSWSYSSTEILAVEMVSAHVCELFRRSKACMKALSALIRCKWDNEICTRASSLYNLIDVHSKVVASIVNKAGPLQSACFEVGQSLIPRSKSINMVICLSHTTPHVRALSISVLRDILYMSTNDSRHKPRNNNGILNPSYPLLHSLDWKTDIDKCLLWEAQIRLSKCPRSFLTLLQRN